MAEKITLKEVAARAGVSYQTVSKVLNKQVTVSKETEERIWNAVKELGYRPNLLARSMRSQRSHMIGYSWEHTPVGQVNPILDQFLQSMVAAAENAGYHMLGFPHRPGRQWLAAYQELIDTHRVDGFVLSSVDYNDPRIEFLTQRKFPFVAFGRSNPDWQFPYVDVDGGDGMRQVVEHLVSLGHRRIAAIAWPEASRVGQNRMEGLRAGLRAHGLNLPEKYLLRGVGSYDFGFEAARRLLSLPEGERPTALIAFNDLMAVGACAAARQLGLPAGQQVAITGFDDTPMIQYLDPALTSISQPIWDVGQKILRKLLNVLEDEPHETSGELICPQLVVRASSRDAIVNQ